MNVKFFVSPGSQVTTTINPQNIVPLPDLNRAIKVMLSNRDCATFVENLINKVAERTKISFIADYLPDLLDNVQVDFSQQYMRDGTPIAGKAPPRDAAGIAHLGISPRSAKGLTEIGYKNAVYTYAETYLHELIHYAGGTRRYTDQELAEAAVALGNLPEGAKKWFDQIKPGDIKGYSDFYDSILQNHCPGPLGKPQFPK